MNKITNNTISSCGLLLLMAVTFGFVRPAISAACTPRQDNKKSEVWRGELEISNITLNIEMHFTPEADGTLSGKLISIDQGGVEIPCDAVTLTDSVMEFDVARLGLRSKGLVKETKSAVRSNNRGWKAF